jgi:hypothetical protein
MQAPSPCFKFACFVIYVLLVAVCLIRMHFAVLLRMVAKAEVSAAPACLDFTACSVYVAGDDEANRKGWQ